MLVSDSDNNWGRKAKGRGRYSRPQPLNISEGHRYPQLLFLFDCSLYPRFFPEKISLVTLAFFHLVELLSHFFHLFFNWIFYINISWTCDNVNQTTRNGDYFKNFFSLHLFLHVGI